MIFDYLLLTLNILLILFLIGYLLFMAGSLFSDAPFIPVRRAVVAKIIGILRLDDKSVLYDLGAGDGRVLCAAAEVSSRIRCIGIESSLLAYFVGAMKTRKYPAIAFKKKNIFDHEYYDATHIYLYMFPEAMKKLEKKFDRELKSSTRVVSCDFVFPGREAIEIIDISAPDSSLAKKLYVYEW